MSGRPGLAAAYTGERCGCWPQSRVRVEMGVAETERSRSKKPAAAGPLGEPVIPDKLYFRIGEVARLLEIAPHVLRFWESEFPQLHPNKGGSGQRLYRRRDVEMALRIKCLLYDEGYTIPGARQLLKAEPRQKEAELPFHPESATPDQHLRKLRSGLQEVSDLLSRPLPGTRRTPRTEQVGPFIVHRHLPEAKAEPAPLFQVKPTPPQE